MEIVCKICSNKNNSVFVIKEMMFGSQQTFDYFQCSSCGTIQIAEIPKDMKIYYPDNYYSFSNENNFKLSVEKFILKHSIRRQLGKFDAIGWLDPLYKKHLSFAWLNSQYGRCFFLYSKKSTECLVNEYGFKIDNMICDPHEKQFIISESYRSGMSLSELTPISKKHRKVLRDKAILLNNELRGDQACFFLKKI